MTDKANDKPDEERQEQKPEEERSAGEKPVEEPEDKPDPNDEEEQGVCADLVARARAMRFRNPELAAGIASETDEPESALEKLAKSESYMLRPKMSASNPQVDREPPGLTDRLRHVMRIRRRR